MLGNNFIILNLLINCGANIDCQDIDNNTPLHFSSRMGYEKLVEYLLKIKARSDLKNIQGETPLDIVANINIFSVFDNFIRRFSSGP